MRRLDAVGMQQQGVGTARSGLPDVEIVRAIAHRRIHDTATVRRPDRRCRRRVGCRERRDCAARSIEDGLFDRGHLTIPLREHDQPSIGRRNGFERLRVVKVLADRAVPGLPRQVHTAIESGPPGQHPGGRVEADEPRRALFVRPDGFGNELRISRQSHRDRVESLRQQLFIAHEQQTAVGVHAGRPGFGQRLGGAACGRHRGDGVAVHIVGRDPVHEQHVASVRQEPRPTMRDLLLRAIGCRQRHGRAAVRWYAIQAAIRKRRVHDDVVASPRAAARVGDVRDGPRHAAREIHAPQSAPREKADRSAVRRPERRDRAIGTGDRLHVERVQRPHEEARTGRHR